MSPVLLAHLIVLAVLMGLLLAAGLGDLKTYRIPNGYSLALLALYPLFVLSAPQPVAPLTSLGLTAGVFALAFTFYTLRAMGAGDVKLLSATALFAGPTLMAEFLVITALSGGVIAMLMLNRQARAGLAVAFDRIGSVTLRDALLTDVIPYGVAIAAGGFYLTLRLAGLAAEAR